jgi:hypothetical protein
MKRNLVMMLAGLFKIDLRVVIDYGCHEYSPEKNGTRADHQDAD